MIGRTKHLTINLAGDGVEKSILLDLEPELGSKIKAVASVSLMGPNPLPEVSSLEQEGKVKLIFTAPLNKFNGNNGYTIHLALVVA